VCIVDGNTGLRRAVELLWPMIAVQRCCVLKLRNLERKAPQHARAEIRDDFHRIVYAASGETARTVSRAVARKWEKRCPGVVRSLCEGGDELLTFFGFPKTQWKILRTTNVIERLHGEFRRRVKTHRGVADGRRGGRSPLQPRGQWSDQTPQGRRIAKDRHGDPTAHAAGGVIHVRVGRKWGMPRYGRADDRRS
jgi:hypothetical protein